MYETVGTAYAEHTAPYPIFLYDESIKAMPASSWFHGVGRKLLGMLRDS